MNCSLKYCCTRIALFIWFYSTALLAMADYRFEVLGAHSGAFAERGSIAQDSSIQNTYYFSPVSTSDVPLVEAAFLAKSSYVGVGYQTSVDSNDDEQVVSLSGRAVIADRFFVDIARSDNSLSSGDTRDEGENESIGLGWYFNDYSTLSLTYTSFDFNDGSNSGLARASNDDLDSYTEFNVRSVFEEIDDHIAFEGFVGLGDGKVEGSVLNFGFSVDYYFNNRFSLGGGFAHGEGSGEALSATSFLINTQLFISESLGLSVSYIITALDIALEDQELSTMAEEDASDDGELTPALDDRLQFFEIAVKARF